jgi:hypothetical protein
MATAYVVTAGIGESYRIERVYLDADEAYGFLQDYNGIAPIEPVQVDEWQDGAPPCVYDGPYWRVQWWARMPVAKRRAELRDTDEGERFDDFAIRQQWWTGDALPEAKVVRRELAGTPRIEVAGVSKVEGGGAVLGYGHPGQGRAGGRNQEIASLRSCIEWNETGMATRLCRPGTPSWPSWIRAPWNGWATTS